MTKQDLIDKGIVNAEKVKINPNLYRMYPELSKEEVACIWYGFESRPKCPTCGNETKFYNLRRGFAEFCSHECAQDACQERAQETCLKKYGSRCALHTEEVHKKVVATLVERFGVEHPMKSAEVVDKLKETNMAKYGTEWAISSDAVQANIHKSVEDKYGVDNVFKLKEFQDKAIATKTNASIEYKDLVKKRISEARENASSSFEEENNCTSVKKLRERFGQGWYKFFVLRGDLSKEYLVRNGREKYLPNDIIPQIEEYFATSSPNGASKQEESVYEYVEELVGSDNIIRRSRSILTPYELDIFIPSKNVAIEYDGAYWHKDKAERDLYKTTMCECLGIRLVHVKDRDWQNNKDIVKSIISSALGIYERRIYARQCNVVELSADVYEAFMESNHVHGVGQMASKRIGLEYNGELVQAIGVGVDRFSRSSNKSMELYRMATTINTQVIGGFSKLIAHCGCDELMSYVDLGLFNCSGYLASGFSLIGQTPMGFCYVKGDRVLPRQSAMKHLLPSLLGDKFDPNETEEENMNRCGWFRSWDCGNAKLIYRR